MSVWNAVVGAAGNLLGGAFGSSVQRKENAKNRAFQREMLANQQAFAREVNAQEMAYNDRVNAENREWNSVGAQRQRLEDAGYNPYLKDGGESVQGSAGSLAVGNASLPGNQDAPLAFADAVRNGMSSFQQVAALDESTRSSKLDNALKEYQLNKLKANDAEINPSTGKKTYFNDAAKQAADIDATRKSASVSAANAAAQDMQNAWNEAQALGENSMPLTNPDGTPMTNLQAMNKGLLSEQRSKVNEIISRAHLADSEADVNDAEALLKKYHLEVEAPVLFQSMKQSLENLKAEFRKIHADTDKALADAGLSSANISLVGEKIITEGETRKNMRSNRALINQQLRTETVKRHGMSIDNRWKPTMYSSQERANEASTFRNYSTPLLHTNHQPLEYHRINPNHRPDLLLTPPSSLSSRRGSSSSRLKRR